MKQLNLILLFFFMGLTQLSAQYQQRQMNVNGELRSFGLSLPTGHSNSGSYPLVIVLHGNPSNGIQMQALTEFDQLGNSENFVTVYPDAHFRAATTPNPVDECDIGNALIGLGFWPVYSPVSTTAMDREERFLSDLIYRMIANRGVDASKVYLVGLSGGGMLTGHMAFRMCDRIAAFANVAGQTPDLFSSFNPGGVVPYLHIHGTADMNVDYFQPEFNDYLAVEPGMKKWAQANGLSTMHNTANIPDTDPSDGSTVTRYSYGSGNIVELLKVDNGGHQWPNSVINPDNLPSCVSQYTQQLGNLNRDIDANTEIWNFFKTKSLDCNNIPTIQFPVLANHSVGDYVQFLGSVFRVSPSGTGQLVLSGGCGSLPRRHVAAFNNEGVTAESVATDAVEFSAFPNPLQNELNIQLSGISGQPAQIVLTDLQGRTLQTRWVGSAHGGNQTIQMEVSNLAQGVYVLQLLVGDVRMTRRIVKE